MRIGFSEPECSNCFHCRLLNTQESEPSNVIASSVNSTLVNSEPVQVLGHDDSAATGSISTFSFGSQTPSVPPVITSVCSEPVQTLAPTSLRSDLFGSPFQTTSGSGASAISTSSTSSLFQGSSPFGFAPAVTSVNSAPTTQAFGQITFAFGSSPNGFESPFAVTSVSSSPTQAFGPNSFGFGASATSTSSTSSPVQTSSQFGFAPTITSVSSPPTQASGQTTFGFFSLFAAPTQPMQAPVKATSGFGAFSMQAPVEALFGSGASGTSTSSSFLPFGSIPAPPTNASSIPDVGVLPATPSSNIFGPNPSTPTEVFGAKPGSVSWPAQDYPRTGVNKFALRSTPCNLFGQNILPTGSFPGFPGYGVDYLPGSNSNPFGPNPYTTGGGSIFGGPKTSSPQPFGFNAATTPLPSSSTTFSSNPLPIYGGSCHNEQCISHPRYAPTPDGDSGGKFMSVSASKSHPYKSHEELRWEDYRKGNKGSKTNVVFASPQMASPSIFAPPSVPDHPQRTTFGTTQESFTGPVSVFPQHNLAFTGFGT